MSSAISARLVSRQQIARDTWDFDFRVEAPGPLRFQPGQFMTLTVGQETGTDKTIRRSYSIASFSHEKERLRFLIKVGTQGPAMNFWEHLAVGTSVPMTGPHGFFTMLPSHFGDVVFVATGTGLAPVLSMLGTLSAESATGQRILYWGLRDEGDEFLADELRQACKAANVDARTYLSKPTGAWNGYQGRVTAAVLQDLPRLNAPTFYLVGNGAMIQELKTALVERGIDRKKQIRTESFYD